MTDMRPLVDFDHHSLDYAQNSWDILSKLREEAPIAWSERYGGAWIVTRYEDVKAVFRDDVTFVTRHDIPNNGRSYTGVELPELPVVLIPMNVDGDELKQYRRLLNPPFSLGEVNRLEGLAVEFARWCLDQQISGGEIDIVGQYANPVPALVTMQLLGLPLEEWEFYGPPFHDKVAYPVGTPGNDRAVAALRAINHRLLDVFADRRQRPRDDLLTRIVGMRIDGELLPDETLQKVVQLILGGGVDTTASLVASALHYLSDDTDARFRLINEPHLIPAACEEFLRYFTPGQVHVRTAARDTMLGGQEIREGERVLVSMASANWDPRQFERPGEVVLDRSPNLHASFGFGRHHCLGAHIARLELKVMLAEFLQRVPDYEVLPGSQRYETIGIVNGWMSMPARFTPGERVGTQFDGVLAPPKRD
jgi:cytochrome P450